MIKKTFSLLVLYLLISGSFVCAQTDGAGTGRSESYWKFDFSAGPNLDLGRPRSSENARVFGTRPKVVPSFGFRAAYLFAPKIGAYVGVRIDFYKEIRTEYLKQSWADEFFENFFNEIAGPLAYTKPSVETGLVYRLERKRWNLHPGIGIGYSNYLPDRNRKRTRTDQDGTVRELFYVQDASMLTINAGFSAHYFVTPRGFITLNAHFQQPLQSSYAELNRTTDGVETFKRAHRTAELGRNATLSIGYGFIFARKGM